MNLGGNTDALFALSVRLRAFFSLRSTRHLQTGGMYMKKISGNRLLVKALREEGVDTMFGYPGACTIDLSDELYKQD